MDPIIERAEQSQIPENLSLRVDAIEREDHPFHIRAIEKKITAMCTGLKKADPLFVAQKIYNSLTPSPDLDEFENTAIQVVSTLVSREPDYSKLAAKLLHEKILREVKSQGVQSFSDSIKIGNETGLISDVLLKMVSDHSLTLDTTPDDVHSTYFEYFGLKTVYDRYLLRHPETRKVIETPQYFYLRVACGLSENVSQAKTFYSLISKFDFMPSTPTLFNSGTQHPQLSSCFLLDSPQDDLMSIYQKYMDIAALSKFSGGIGVAYHRVRSEGSLIKGTNGKSNGIIPWLKTLDSSVLAVNQGGKRKGACCVYLESWHADIENFLDLRENTGEESRRTYNINIANWVPDLFMKRVESDSEWALFDPKKVPHFPDLYGEAFEKAYLEAEEKKLFEKKVKARDLYGRMMKSLAQTGNGWMTFKDACNLKNNQTLLPKNVVHLSNLCTEITEVTSDQETAVCNLGSVNLSRHVTGDHFDFKKLDETVQTAVGYLDRVIDLNFYPIEKAKGSNSKWRPIGLGIMGLQDVFFKLRLKFDSKEALDLSNKIQEQIYYSCLKASNQIAKEKGPHENYNETRASQGLLQFDLWGVEPTTGLDWDSLRKEIAHYGLRNSLMIAIAPTATIASIVGSYEATEPMVSNLFKRETMSGEFLQINKYLIRDLQERGLWNEEMMDRLKESEGSIQHIEEIPEDIRALYRTSWELSMKALIDLAAGRGAFIDQSQSLNLFIESPTIGKVSSMYMYAWKSGLKTTYYLRSRPATRINRATTRKVSEKKEYTESEALACSLENPEACEACQ